MRSAYPITIRSAELAATAFNARASRMATALVIERHAVRRAADRHRADNPPGPRIDDGDVVTCAIGDEQPAFIPAERQVPRPAPHQDVAADLLAPGIDDSNSVGMSECHVSRRS